MCVLKTIRTLFWKCPASNDDLLLEQVFGSRWPYDHFDWLSRSLSKIDESGRDSQGRYSSVVKGFEYDVEGRIVQKITDRTDALVFEAQYAAMLSGALRMAGQFSQVPSREELRHALTFE